jgi:hypothetical protein
VTIATTSGVALEDILGYMPLTEALRTKASGVPNPFPAEFFQTAPANKVMGDRAKYVIISGERRTAKRAKYGSPAVRRALRDVGDQAVKLLHLSESFAVDLMVLQQLRSFEKYSQDAGMDWLRYQLDEAARRIANTEVITTASVLKSGAIYFDSNGNLLPSSSGADTNATIDFGVPATHQNQCNGIIDSSWLLTGTDIPGHIAGLQRYALEETGMELGAALYGKSIAKAIRQNSYCQAFLSRNPGLNDKLSMGYEIPDGLFGIKKWIPVYQSFYETDDSGTVAEIWDDNQVTFVPNVAQPDKMTWYVRYEGSLPVPRTIDVQKDPMAAIKNAELVYGAGGYSVATVAPPGVECYTFHTFLPAVRNPKALFQATCIF